MRLRGLKVKFARIVSVKERKQGFGMQMAMLDLSQSSPKAVIGSSRAHVAQNPNIGRRVFAAKRGNAVCDCYLLVGAISADDYTPQYATLKEARCHFSLVLHSGATDSEHGRSSNVTAA